MSSRGEIIELTFRAALGRVVTVGLLLFTAFVASAGDVEVVVTDRAGRALEGVRVSPDPVGATSRDRIRAFAMIPHRAAATDASGRAAFRDLRPGVYEFSVSPPEGYVAPGDNPFERPSRVTLREDDTRIEIPLRLWRGSPVRMEMSIAEGPYERVFGTLRIASAESSFSREMSLEDGVSVRRLLVPGRYHVEFEAPTGFLVSGFEIDGVEQKGVSATLDVESTLREMQILAHVRTTATIVGRVTTDDGEDGRIASLSTRLVAPGEWIAEGRAAERPIPVTAGGRFVDRERFEMWSMDGTWEIRAFAEGYEASPEVHVVEVPAGAQVRADFDLRRVSETPNEDRGRIRVTVYNPWQRRVDDAQVGLWRATDDPLQDSPLAVSKKRDRWGRHDFDRLPLGSYRVVAWQRGFLETEERVTVGESEEERTRSITVSLDRGAVLRFEALTEAGEAEREVVVEAERLNDPPPRVFPLEARHGDEPSFVRRGVTDDSGRGEIGGLDEGEFLVRARVRGALARERFVRVRASGRLEESIDVQISEGETVDLDLVSLPAASLELTIACDDGFPLPAAASIRVLEFDADVASRRDDPDLRENVALALDGVTLRGTARETLIVGPLDTGAYHVAVRPEGFGAWWWVGADHDRRGASTINASAGSTSEVGFVPIECAPVLEIPIDVPDDTEAFDLRDGDVSVEMRPLDDPEASWIPLEVDEFATLARAVRLPESPIALRARVEHPWLLPDGEARFELEVELERGQLAERGVDADPLGGAIVVRGNAPAYRVEGTRAEGGGERVVSSRVGGEGGILVPALVPGRYAVSACADVPCDERAAPLWLEVEPGRTTRVELDLEDAASRASGRR